MEKYSCWNWNYSKRYYITHPWKWFKDLGRNIKDVCMRARYGFTWADVWSWDHWFLHTTPNMLRHMADHGNAYPGHEPFDTPEKWHEWLHRMADLLESGTEEYQDAHNEFRDEYTKELLTGKRWLDEHIDEDGNVHHTLPELSELGKKYWARSKELAEEGEANVAQAMADLGAHFFDAWD
jgi:hypothetical protein